MEENNNKKVVNVLTIVKYLVTLAIGAFGGSQITF